MTTNRYSPMLRFTSKFLKYFFLAVFGVAIAYILINDFWDLTNRLQPDAFHLAYVFTGRADSALSNGDRCFSRILALESYSVTRAT
jgi:hypothetical protein